MKILGIIISFIGCLIIMLTNKKGPVKTDIKFFIGMLLIMAGAYIRGAQYCMSQCI